MLSSHCVWSWGALIQTFQYRYSSVLNKYFSWTSWHWDNSLQNSLIKNVNWVCSDIEELLLTFMSEELSTSNSLTPWCCSAWIFLWTDVRWCFFKSRFLFFSACFSSLSRPCIVGVKLSVSHHIVCNESAEGESSSRESLKLHNFESDQMNSACDHCFDDVDFASAYCHTTNCWLWGREIRIVRFNTYLSQIGY
jgi:hypothetical protein